MSSSGISLKHLSSFKGNGMHLNICGYSSEIITNIQLMFFFPRNCLSSLTHSCSSSEFRLRLIISQKSSPVSVLFPSPTYYFPHPSKLGIFLPRSLSAQNMVCIFLIVLQQSADFSDPSPTFSSHSQVIDCK